MPEPARRSLLGWCFFWLGVAWVVYLGGGPPTGSLVALMLAGVNLYYFARSADGKDG